MKNKFAAINNVKSHNTNFFSYFQLHILTNKKKNLKLYRNEEHNIYIFIILKSKL